MAVPEEVMGETVIGTGDGEVAGKIIKWKINTYCLTQVYDFH